MRLDDYVGKLMVHTPKAVKSGCPAERVFSVCGIIMEDGKKYLLAWKCTMMANGKLDHPAYKRSLVLSDKRLFMPKRGKNGALPTASFRPDSFYKLME